MNGKRNDPTGPIVDLTVGETFCLLIFFEFLGLICIIIALLGFLIKYVQSLGVI